MLPKKKRVSFGEGGGGGRTIRVYDAWRNDSSVWCQLYCTVQCSFLLLCTTTVCYQGWVTEASCCDFLFSSVCIQYWLIVFVVSIPHTIILFLLLYADILFSLFFFVVGRLTFLLSFIPFPVWVAKVLPLSAWMRNIFSILLLQSTILFSFSSTTA